MAGSFSGVSGTLTTTVPFYENLAKRPLLPLYAHFLSVTFTFFSNTPSPNFRRRHVRARKGAGGGAELAPDQMFAEGSRISDVIEEGAVERGRESRLARATRSGFAHAIKNLDTWLMRSDCFPVALSANL